MSDKTKIEWADATVNAINGCSVVSPGCTNCYAMRLAGTRMKDHPSRQGLTVDSKAGPVWNGQVRLSEAALLQPLKWKAPRRIFWNAHGDLFHDAVPEEWIDRVFAVCALTPQHTHMILTKRPERMRGYLAMIPHGRWTRWMAHFAQKHPRPEIVHPTSGGILLKTRNGSLLNVWLGVSVEDQARADDRVPHLLATPAAKRFLSCEPLLGPVDLAELSDGLPTNAWFTWLDGLDWVIVGGESGPMSRPMHADWARSLRDQCAAAGVPFHFKQWGEFLPEGQFDRDRFEWAPGNDDPRVHWWRDIAPDAPVNDGDCSIRIGKRQAGRYLDDVEHDGVPA